MTVTARDRGRWLAVDWGERRIGLAISDPTGTIASPAGLILRRTGKRPPIAELIRRAENQQLAMRREAGNGGTHRAALSNGREHDFRTTQFGQFHSGITGLTIDVMHSA